MDIGAIFIGIALLIIAVSYVAGPFRKPKKEQVAQEPATAQQLASSDLKSQQQIALRRLRELDFDYQTGKISDDDYQPLRDRYAAEAARLIEALEQQDARIEAKLRLRRQAKAKKEKCAACGADLQSKDQFCPKCGQPRAAACWNCGKTIRTGDLYCSTCGSPVKKPDEAAAIAT